MLNIIYSQWYACLTWMWSGYSYDSRTDSVSNWSCKCWNTDNHKRCSSRCRHRRHCRLLCSSTSSSSKAVSPQLSTMYMEFMICWHCNDKIENLHVKIWHAGFLLFSASDMEGKNGGRKGWGGKSRGNVSRDCLLESKLQQTVISETVFFKNSAYKHNLQFPYIRGDPSSKLRTYTISLHSPFFLSPPQVMCERDRPITLTR